MPLTPDGQVTAARQEEGSRTYPSLSPRLATGSQINNDISGISISIARVPLYRIWMLDHAVSPPSSHSPAHATLGVPSGKAAATAMSRHVRNSQVHMYVR